MLLRALCHCLRLKQRVNTTALIHFDLFIGLYGTAYRSLGKRISCIESHMVDEHNPDIIIGCDTYLDETYQQ